MSFEYIKSFIIGGSIIAGSKYISTKTNPVYGSIIGGIPTGIIASFFLTSGTKEYFRAYAYHSIFLAITINVIYQMIQRNILSDKKTEIIGLLFWGLLSLLFAKFYLLKK